MSTSSSSRRLPDELVVMVIDWCDHLDDKRLGTLAALCRLSKRFTPVAERLLYSDLVLNSYPGEPLNTNSALYALIKHPRLRRLVKKVDLYIENESLDDMSDEIIHVLCGMPNIQDMLAPALPAARLVLANPECRLLSFNPFRWDNDAASLMVDRPTAFTVLQHVGVEFEDGLTNGPPPVLPAFSSLAVRRGHELPAFALFTAPLAGQLTDLVIYHSSNPFSPADLSAWIRLRRLEVYTWVLHDRVQLDRSIPGVVAILQSVPRSPVFTSFALRLVASESGSTAGAEASFELPASSNDILLALPPHLHHLSLVTNAIRSVDLATYLLSSLRPPALRTLRVGHALGSGFRAILDDADGVHSALAGELERAGIEVTTTAAER
ncbi:uncharacterized protein RHOBADRAFT_45469 [Rhodotorula graminis WP1]|uniref:F-box domain-containing protein n=1 Tax=Rhodotorula graminis (strain WP1) TaxID=578459 RepID=A0A0P9ENB7_RHOGW|nr:uncharacterized protein RHOBADRAFT_45469 [Rhodotorula graminis WP1]KPV73506.1 hypothetical protein RHOBADRAFT_45469 [Rhodotorula graminis WP1]